MILILLLLLLLLRILPTSLARVILLRLTLADCNGIVGL
jgi:hypothetical protein